MTESTRTGDEETPVLFPAGDATVFGIVSHPTMGADGRGVIVLGGGAATSTGPNRLSVRLCRRLATRGYHCMRFDYHGVGESTGVAERFRLDQPFTEDLEGAVQCLKEHGVREIALVGYCFGARTALSCAARLPEVRDVVLVATPVRDFEMGDDPTGYAIHFSTWVYIKRALRPRVIRRLADPNARRLYAKAAKAKWAYWAARFRGSHPIEPDERISEGFLEDFSRMAGGRARVLVIQGTEDDEHEEFQWTLSGRMGEILRSSNGAIEVRPVPGGLHGFRKMDTQLSVIGLIADWLEERRAPSRVRTTSGEGHGIQLD